MTEYISMCERYVNFIKIKPHIYKGTELIKKKERECLDFFVKALQNGCSVEDAGSQAEYKYREIEIQMHKEFSDDQHQKFEGWELWILYKKSDTY